MYVVKIVRVVFFVFICSFKVDFCDVLFFCCSCLFFVGLFCCEGSGWYFLISNFWRFNCLLILFFNFWCCLFIFLCIVCVFFFWCCSFLCFCLIFYLSWFLCNFFCFVCNFEFWIFDFLFWIWLFLLLDGINRVKRVIV